MKSKTKYFIDEEKIKEIFSLAKLGDAINISELKAGEFNAAYFVATEDREYVLKIAPLNNKNTLTYEKDIMEREVAFYKCISEQTDVKTPYIYFHDDTKHIIPSNYFIMEKLCSIPLSDCKIEKVERDNAYSKIGEMVASLHNIKGKGFGYEQNGLQNNWYEAIKSMTENLINDCRKYNKKLKAGHKLLNYIETCKDILLKVEPTFTHFDIWDGNVFYENKNNEISLTLIDTERGFWGDSLGDFVSIEMFKDLKNKGSIQSYNKTAKNPIQFTKEEQIRFNIMRAYLGLIVYTEKYARYKFLQSKYFINCNLSKYFIKTSFSAINKLL